MKNRNTFSLGVIVSSFVLFSFIPVDSFSQGKSPDETLLVYPQPVAGIFKTSCVGCHSDQSKGKAKEFMNLSEWDKLNSKKQAKMGKSITKIVNKGVMPPEQFLQRRPEAAVTPEQKKEIMAWAKSVKKKK